MLVTSEIFTMDVDSDSGLLGRNPRATSDFSIAAIIGRSGRAVAAEVLKLKAKNKLLGNNIRPLGMF
jgi:hypothetical protein